MSIVVKVIHHQSLERLKKLVDVDVLPQIRYEKMNVFFEQHQLEGRLTDYTERFTSLPFKV